MTTRLLLAATFFGAMTTAHAQSRLLHAGPLFAQAGASSMFCNISNVGGAPVTIDVFHVRDRNGNAIENFNTCSAALPQSNVLPVGRACSIAVVGAPGSLKNELVTCDVIVTTTQVGGSPSVSGTLDARNADSTNLLYVVPLQ